jgi:hypothetical protein
MLIFTRLALLAVLAGCGRTTERPVATNSALARPALATAFRDHRSHVWIEGAGTVTRLLRDDTKPPRHQRFVVQVENADFTVMIAHDIDVAPRVPFKTGDRIEFRGEYIWSEQGGIVHWTHHARGQGKDSGGWIRWRDFVYR